MPDKHQRPTAPKRIGPLQAAEGLAGIALIAAVIGGACYLVFASGIAFFEDRHGPNPAKALFAVAIGTVLLVTFALRLPRPLTLTDLRSRTIDWFMLAIGVGLLVIAADQGGFIASRNLSVVLMGVVALGIYVASTSPFPTTFASLRKSNTVLLLVGFGLILFGVFGAAP